MLYLRKHPVHDNYSSEMDVEEEVQKDNIVREKYRTGGFYIEEQDENTNDRGKQVKMTRKMLMTVTTMTCVSIIRSESQNLCQISEYLGASSLRAH